MTAKELFNAGQLNAAIQALVAVLRDNPADTRQRTFLFELLCFAGEYDRAEKHLEIIAQESPDATTGALLYRAALAAERTRREVFEKAQYSDPASTPESHSGTLNGQPFQSLEDADPRLGPRLEIFAAGDYLWLPLEHVASIQMEAPKRLRDLLWIPATVLTGPSFNGQELGQVLIPALSPFSFKHADDAVRLGRVTVWEEQGGEAVPFGQKMLLVDGEEIPLLEVRSLELNAAETTPQAHASAQ
ncbi:MAG TPA: type VI secretion system accessory protein TagJ [Candidatus Limnocylindrales bacterium]|nr:type VI secretion system accessory protein TagJ [Candidatus Limnocylindrales bacterium]